MHALVLTVLAIALSAMALTMTVNHIPLSATMQAKALSSSELGVHQLESGIVRYLDASRDGDGYLVYPGTNTDMIPLVTPSFAFLPAAPEGFTWEVRAGLYEGTEPGVWGCLRPTGVLDETYRPVLQRLKQRLPVGSAFINVACGSTVSDDFAGDRLTFWVLLSHFD